MPVRGKLSSTNRCFGWYTRDNCDATLRAASWANMRSETVRPRFPATPDAMDAGMDFDGSKAASRSMKPTGRRPHFSSGAPTMYASATPGTRSSFSRISAG